MSAEQELRNAISSVINKGATTEEMAEDIVRHLKFSGGQDYLITNGKVYAVLESEVVDSMDGEYSWNVYTTEEES